MKNIIMHTYQQGHKREAFDLFLMDESGNEGVSFDRFCNAIDKIIKNRQELESCSQGHKLNFI